MNHNTLIFEACVGNFKQAKDAELRGASRIELCENLSEGGTTPSFGTIKLTRQLLNIPVFSIIRPRGGDFVYSNEEIEIMIEDIILYRHESKVVNYNHHRTFITFTTSY